MDANPSKQSAFLKVLYETSECIWDRKHLIFKMHSGGEQLCYTREQLAEVEVNLPDIADEMQRWRECGIKYCLKNTFIHTLNYWNAKLAEFFGDTEEGPEQFLFTHIDDLSAASYYPPDYIKALFWEYHLYGLEHNVKFAYLHQPREVVVPITWFDSYMPGSSAIIRIGIELGLDGGELAQYALKCRNAPFNVALPPDLSV